MARSGYYQSGGAFGFRDQLNSSQYFIRRRNHPQQFLLFASRQFRKAMSSIGGIHPSEEVCVQVQRRLSMAAFVAARYITTDDIASWMSP